ncbi:MAG: hypothetical protein U5L96_00055 [Owenweeksia sp.]|nr:hypothetical protein [Owenweeksia sp.]
MPDTLVNNLKFDGINGQDVAKFEKADLQSLYTAGASYCDGAVIGSENVSEELKESLKKNVDNFLDFKGEDYVNHVHDLYKSICVEESVA